MITHLSEHNRHGLTREERTRILKAIKKGQSAFWEAVTESLPEIETDKVTETQAFSFNYGCERLVAEWYRENKPQGQNHLDL